MKKFTMMLAMAATMAFMSCNKDDVSDSGSGEPKGDSGTGYVSISVDSTYSRAGVYDDTDENKIHSLALLTFDYNYDYIGYHNVYLTDGEFLCEVAADSRRFFVVVNPSDDILTAVKEVSAYSQSQFSTLPALAMLASDVSTKNYKSNSDETRGFTMVNCGEMNSSGILLESLVSVTTSLGETADTATPITIYVDRMVAKFDYAIDDSFDDYTESMFTGGYNLARGSVEAVALTATNKASYLYSMINTNTLTDDNVYRTDHNMAVGETLQEEGYLRDALTANFNWLKNGGDETTEAAFDSSSTDIPEFVLENTVTPSYSNSNNLTQAIVKAKYNRMLSDGTLPELGASWFKMYTSDGTGTLYLSFDDVVDLYNGDYTSFTVDDDVKDAMDLQLQKIMGDDTYKWNKVGLSIEDLDAKPYGGYNAATVENESDYVLIYYQNAINYYDIFIQHDANQPVGHLGRWGMVRNNSYTMNITGIMQEGLPYIPDPTDPAIVDPENQDPTNPEPADEPDAYISVTISVNPWVIWSQDSPLM
ncbi:MAG: Mfa1 family fimbria major subunit [Rikenellaceae bacterium]